MIYYHNVRKDIHPLLPTCAPRILDVGAGAGATLAWLKTIYPGAQTTGIELNPDLEVELKKNADVAIIGDVNECIAQLGTYDLILLLDVLEHLPDSIATLQKIRDLLRPEGSVIVSLPNVSHLSVALPLLFHRRFAYQDAGILDRTHLRFFVEESAIKLMNNADLVVTKGVLSGPKDGPKSKLLNCLSLGLLRHHLTRQYIMVGKVNEGKTVQRRVKWEIGN
jgi:2-polyprenyl-3-methyl-5-hydroxy-6-metoxy-1,4-benzoquinol methylase